MGELSPTHWLILIAIGVLLFGARRLPDAARALGRSARILRAEVRAISDDAPAGTSAGTGTSTSTATATSAGTSPVSSPPAPEAARTPPPS